jgi:hypothetical protein
VPRPMPNGTPALWQASRLEERIERPIFGLGRGAGWVQGLNVDASMLLQEVDARAGPLDLIADRCRHGEPMAFGAAEVGDDVVDWAVVFDELGHHVVDGLEALRIVMRQPARHVDDVMACPGLRLRGKRQQRLVARVAVDLDLDLLLLRPLLDQRVGSLVRARHEMIPESERELAGRVRRAHERRGHDGGRGCRQGRKEAATGKLSWH